jgi:hypothetical protein
METLSVFEFLSIIKPFNPEVEGEVFVTFLQLGFEEVWFNVSQDDFEELRSSGLVSMGWTMDAKQALMGNSTRDNF